MKLFTGIFFVLFTVYGINAQSLKKKDLKRIQHFLTDFQDAVAKKDSMQLKTMIYPLSVGGMDIRAKIIEAALKGSEQGSGDFSYSDKAFGIIVDSLVEKFTPLTKQVRDMLERNPAFREGFGSYSNEQIAILDYKKVHIILLLNTPKVQLLFWEGMNNLLRK